MAKTVTEAKRDKDAFGIAIWDGHLTSGHGVQTVRAEKLTRRENYMIVRWLLGFLCSQR